MTLTVVVEPDPGGHRFQYVRHVVDAARLEGDDVLLLTIHGARGTEQFAAYLAGVPIEIDECFDVVRPPTATIAKAVADRLTGRRSRVLLMDADQALKHWWRVAPALLRSVPSRPTVVFLLTRYPARLGWADRLGWMHRVSKGTLAAVAAARGVLSRTVTLAGRDDRAPGWFIKRVRDPAICTAHSRDRAALRSELDLRADRRYVGISGVINERKNAPLVHAACLAAGDDIDLVLAGSVAVDVTAWLDTLTAAERARVVVHDGFLANEVLDKYVAAVDVVAIAQNNNGPSGIMGKALAARVPVLSAGSVVRAREIGVTGGGTSTELTVPALSAGIVHLLAGGIRWSGDGSLVGPEQFAATLLRGAATP